MSLKDVLLCVANLKKNTSSVKRFIKKIEIFYNNTFAKLIPALLDQKIYYF